MERKSPKNSRKGDLYVSGVDGDGDNTWDNPEDTTMENTTPRVPTDRTTPPTGMAHMRQALLPSTGESP